MASRHTVELTTTGRRTGQPRIVTLYAFDDGERMVVVGSLGGAAHDPDWVHNLRAEPRAILKVGGDVLPVRAHEVGDAERERLWDLVSEAFPLYLAYQRRTARTIPLFALEADAARSPADA